MIALATLVLVLWSATTHAQQTRQAEIATMREQKAQTLHPYSRTRVERVLFTLEDKQLVGRLFDPPHGPFARVGGLTEGAGFAAGPAYRLGVRGFRVTASGVLSTKGYSTAEAAFDAPDLAGGRLFVGVTARRIEFPQEIFFGLGPGSLDTRTSTAP